MKSWIVIAVAALMTSPVMAASPSKTAPKARYNEDLVEVQIKLSRANFSPGVIDGYDGPNLRRAVAAFAQARGIKSSGELNEDVRSALEADSPSAFKSYVIKASDVAGPFAAPLQPNAFEAMAKRPALSYADAKEALAEKFRVSEALLDKLNPGADFAAGDVITAPAFDGPALQGVAKVVIDAKARSLFAYDGNKKLIGFFPATIGAAASIPPSATLEVERVVFGPAYFYEPVQKTFAPGASAGALRIAPGPNNPFGSVWIDLTEDFCGIQGSPEPRMIGKPDLEGCIRLTNWDAIRLGRAVRLGTEIGFAGSSAKMALN